MQRGGEASQNRRTIQTKTNVCARNLYTFSTDSVITCNGPSQNRRNAADVMVDLVCIESVRAKGKKGLKRAKKNQLKKNMLVSQTVQHNLPKEKECSVHFCRTAFEMKFC